jgi:phosphohistidine phosphatase
MKQLFLLRHGEAGISEGPDLIRTLTQKGIDQLERMGNSFNTQPLQIDRMVCSPANRTLETADIIKKFIEVKEEIFFREIYDGDLEALVKILQETSFSINSCLLVGHNPTISELVGYLSGDNFLGLQTGMMVELTLELTDWEMISEGIGILKRTYE